MKKLQFLSFILILCFVVTLVPTNKKVFAGTTNRVNINRNQRGTIYYPASDPGLKAILYLDDGGSGGPGGGGMIIPPGNYWEMIENLYNKLKNSFLANTIASGVLYDIAKSAISKLFAAPPPPDYDALYEIYIDSYGQTSGGWRYGEIYVPYRNTEFSD